MCFPNLNQLYMAGLMTSPMVLIELALMGAMYPNKALNIVIAVLSGLALIAFFLFIQAANRNLRYAISENRSSLTTPEQS